MYNGNCVDELDKMPRTFQNQLVNFMDSGHVKVDQQRKQYDFEIKGAKVFVSANDIKRLAIIEQIQKIILTQVYRTAIHRGVS
jgi:hypothetical protein